MNASNLIARIFLPRLILPLLCSFSLGVYAQSAACAKNSSTAGSAPLPSTLRLRGQVSELTLMCQAAGLSLDNSKLPGVVTKVGMATPAAHAGFLEGDRILTVSADGDILTMTFDRKGARYQVKLEIRMKAVRAQMDELLNRQMQPPISKSSSPSTKLTAQASQNQNQNQIQTPDSQKFFKALAPYEVILLIDHSGSMNGGLGIGPFDTSRWGWCRSQISDFSNFVGNRLTGGLTIVPFNDTFVIKKFATHKDIEEIFNNVVPSGETDIYSPLSAVIDAHLKDPDHRKKPVLIVVLTDGLPNQGGSLDKLIARATAVLKDNDEMIISFLTVGQAPEGDELIDRLDNTLVARGAKEDIVNSMRFSQLLEVGLKNALLDAVTRAKALK